VKGERLPHYSISIVAQMDELSVFDGQAREQGLKDRDREVLSLQKAKLLLEASLPRFPYRLEVGSRYSPITRDEIARHCHNKKFKSHTQ
jgi:hypothetical protein